MLEAKQKVTTLFIFQFPRTLLSRILMGMSVQIRRGHNELARKTTLSGCLAPVMHSLPNSRKCAKITQTCSVIVPSDNICWIFAQIDFLNSFEKVKVRAKGSLT